VSSEHVFDQKGNIKPKPSQEISEPEKDTTPVTKAEAESKLDAGTLTRMQQTVGNAAVQRFLAQRQESGPGEVDDETAQSIRSSKGSGQSLDENIAAKAGNALGHDFGDVNVHTDSQADSLSQDLGAKAFTTGNDIYFQSGAYNPDTSEGQRLISHELTHVVQQGGSSDVQGKMTVNDPNDQYEAEADSVADMVMNSPAETSVQRQEEDELQMKSVDSVQRQEEDELQMKSVDSVQRQEEEEVMAKADDSIQRQEEDELQMKADDAIRRQEEDELQMKADDAIQRQEEDELQMKSDESIQRQEEEEEMIQPKVDESIQRQEEEEEMIQPKVDESIRRQEEEEMQT
jgi:hypothetical protein